MSGRSRQADVIRHAEERREAMGVMALSFPFYTRKIDLTSRFICSDVAHISTGLYVILS